jgi:hypothetical protein
MGAPPGTSCSGKISHKISPKQMMGLLMDAGMR